MDAIGALGVDDGEGGVVTSLLLNIDRIRARLPPADEVLEGLMTVSAGLEDRVRAFNAARAEMTAVYDGLDLFGLFQSAPSAAEQAAVLRLLGGASTSTGMTGMTGFFGGG